MSNEMKVFENGEFGKVRVVEQNGEPWFVGKDVAEVLGYVNPSKAVLAHVDDDDKVFLMLNIADSQNGNVPFGQSKTALINESGLYSLVISSKLPTAKQFKRWITSDVLPTIRKTGGYVANDALFVDTYLPYADEATKALFGQMLNAISQSNATIAKQQAKIEADAPKTQYYDDIGSAEGTCLIRDVAKLLHQSGVKDMGGTRLYERLREEGILGKSGSGYNLPTQRAIEAGWFTVRETPRMQGGKIVTDCTCRVTPKGKQYLYHKYTGRRLKEGAEG